jgi:multidrug transporter EmrE-like cation transporter
MRKSGIKDPFLGAFLINLATVVVLAPFARNSLSPSTLLTWGVGIALVAGSINGLGHLFNQHLVLSVSEQFSQFGVLVPAVVILTAVLGGVVFFRESLTIGKTVGIGFVIAGIVLISPK